MAYTIMADGVNVASWPADTTHGLVYTDGAYANMTAAKQRFPGIPLQTISVTGAVPAMWVDCEPGCVWPADRAVQVYVSWRAQGCRGVYCAQSTKPAVRAASAAAGVSPEIFGADWSGIPHVIAGEAQTQYLNTPGYDLTAIPAAQPAPPPPPPKPTPDPPGGVTVPSTQIPEPIVAVSSAWNQTRNGGQLDVIMVGKSGAVYHKYFVATGSPAGWYGPELLSGPI